MLAQHKNEISTSNRSKFHDFIAPGFLLNQNRSNQIHDPTGYAS